ncbi:MAG TPA: ribonuclease P protein component [Candidatus Pacearchaeota archaeon]|jgi:ribonuclease P protein component|nr:ribonuclease P protein component [Candidatus Pacearchaeota archaeon]
MLSFKNRIKKEKDFRKVFNAGKIVSLYSVSIRFSQNNLEETRFGFIVSKKISKRAVVRNRVKRIFREQTRLILKDIKGGFDVVVIIKSSSITSLDAKRILLELFKQANILN